jgi:manganese oxidase
LIPGYYELDDFQVRTPTDIVGQHIHLVKFDVLASDGAANGFNYEDGTFSPDEVRARIAAINNAKGLYSRKAGLADFEPKMLTAKSLPFFGSGPAGNWLGAQATVQRWYADPLEGKNSEGKKFDRTLRTVFTHDHFGPSTHQQAGLYAGLLVEPAETEWLDNSDKANKLGGRTAPAYAKDGSPTKDGGPTSWQAIIAYKEEGKKKESYREFALEFQDFQLAYDRTSLQQPVPYAEYATADPVSPWGWMEKDKSVAISPPKGGPTLISTGPEPGTRSMNYRNEPLAFRLAEATPRDPDKIDLSQVYRSIPRTDPDLHRQPTGPINPKFPKGFHYPGGFEGADDDDPYTPLLRAYQGDKVQIRTLVGAHMVGHSFGLHGLRWLTEPSDPESGFRSTQAMGISEHFEMEFELPPSAPQAKPGNAYADYLYMPSSGTDGQKGGLWGLLRAYQGAPSQPLAPLPSNPDRGVLASGKDPIADFYATLPEGKVKTYHVTATTAARALPGRELVYYQRGNLTIADSDALIYVLSDTLGPDGKLLAPDPNQAIEPLILRANAGDLIEVVLENQLNPAGNPLFTQGSPAGPAFRGLKYLVSSNVGLRPQLVSLDVTNDDGFNVGQNPVQTVSPGTNTGTYKWYAGIFKRKADGALEGVPVEFGAVNLLPSDPLMQHPHGLFAALVVEPEGTTWKDNRASTIIYRGGKPIFKEFVAMMQGDPVVPNMAINYKTEPMSARYFDDNKAGRGQSALWVRFTI